MKESQSNMGNFIANVYRGGTEMSRGSCGGVDDSLLFFFLILVLMFCMPGMFGCGDTCSEKC